MIASAEKEPRRLAQLERVLLIIELLAPLRYGATARDITRDVSDLLQPFCERTITRDLEMLQRMGLVDCVRGCSGHRQAIWLWRDTSVRSAIHRRVAELQG